MTDLKTVLVDALNETGERRAIRLSGIPKDDFRATMRESRTRCVEIDQLADRLATAARDHFLDREKVRAALSDILSGVEIDTDHGSIGQLGGRRASYRYPPGIMRPTIRIEDDLVDRLIAGLAGGSE